MDLYKFSFGVLTIANVGLGVLQYRSRNYSTRSRASSSPRSPRSSPRKLSQDLTHSRSSSSGLLINNNRGDGSVFINPFSMASSGPPIMDEEKLSLHNRSMTPLVSNVAERDRDAAWDFQKTFFAVHILVMAADWLQGPYLYTLYKDEKQLAERTVALLFASGFVSAAVAASFVGGLADSHGRKKACLAFCAMYSCSCLSMLSDSILVLFSGRVLGGISSTLMYSCFETWMVHEFHARNMAACGMALGKMLGLMTTVSSIVAIMAGVAGEFVVGWSGTKKAPFMLAMLSLIVAAWLIATKWTENYGHPVQEKGIGLSDGTDIKAIIKDKRIVSLGIISCLFEGSMYLFVFFWSAAVKSARARNSLNLTGSDNVSPPPFGLIFATFMSAMMFGSQLFTITTSAAPISIFGGQIMAVAHHTQFLSLTVLVGALSFLLVSAMTFHTRKEELTLWAFCLFEAMVGIYYPSMGYLKGQIVQDEIRAKVYGLLRLPLNIFVVSVLGLTQEGDRHRDGVFLACGGLLITAYMVAQRFLAQ